MYRGCTGGGVSEGADILGVRRRSCGREIDVDDVSGGFGVGWGRVVEWHRGGKGAGAGADADAVECHLGLPGGCGMKSARPAWVKSNFICVPARANLVSRARPPATPVAIPADDEFSLLLLLEDVELCSPFGSASVHSFRGANLRDRSVCKCFFGTPRYQIHISRGHV